MRARNKKAAIADAGEKLDYLFTWKPERWHHSQLRKLVDTFESRGIVQDWWRCLAHRKIRPGDRAYMLKQGRPIGIFGIGRVVGNAAKSGAAPPGTNPWQVQILFDASLGDVLWDPKEHFLVTEKQLTQLPVPKTQWQIQASGIGLESEAAREIDNISFDSIRVGRRTGVEVDEEILRQRRLIELATRPKQQAFREEIRRNYRDRCAVTGCATPAAFEAAHVSTRKGRDDNNPTNGILLRSDIHALLDRLLITFSEGGMRIEVSPELTDQSYSFLRSVKVARPHRDSLSKENIRKHRSLFLERQKHRSPTRG